jgi:predicted nucleotidyltransferase/DNA-binding MarR family transcriptional regulator
MLLRNDEAIAGMPARAFRDVLRSCEGTWGLGHLAERLNGDQQRARQLLADLIRLDHVKRSDGLSDGEWYELTAAGRRLSNAQVGRGIRRSAAERVLQEFFDRCDEIARDPYWLFFVKKVVVFGSFLTDKQRLGDIDLAVYTVPKERDRKRHLILTKQRTLRGEFEGRVFHNIIESLYYAERETTRYLLNRSRFLNFHENDPILERKSVRRRLIYTAEKGRLIKDRRVEKAPVPTRVDRFSNAVPIIYSGSFIENWNASESAILMHDWFGEWHKCTGRRDRDLTAATRAALLFQLEDMLAKKESPPVPYLLRRRDHEVRQFEVPESLARRIRRVWRANLQRRSLNVRGLG